MNNNAKEKLIHVGKVHLPAKGARYLFLRETPASTYTWYEVDGAEEVKTEIAAPSIEEAMRLAHKTWKPYAFRTLNCGFRYTLPERDEHGINALFHEMVVSYNSPNGVYFDEKRGHHCFVQSASQEALDLRDKLTKSNSM